MKISAPAVRPHLGLGRTLVVAGLLAASLSACVPLVVGGAAVGGTLLVLDRRTSGAQLEDEGIESRASSRIRDALDARVGERGRVAATSYNRILLLTGQVPTEADRKLAETTAAGVPNVRRVINEIIINAPATFTQRSTDALTTTRVKTALVTEAQVDANAVKVVTELGTVYLMGIVTQAEADKAADVVRNVSGVFKVVKVFELVSPAAIGASGSAAATNTPAGTVPASSPSAAKSTTGGATTP